MIAIRAACNIKTIEIDVDRNTITIEANVEPFGPNGAPNPNLEPGTVRFSASLPQDTLSLINRDLGAAISGMFEQVED